MIREAIGRLIEGSSLSEAEAVTVMEEIMTGEATPSQLGAFLTALRLKGETVEEVTGMARVMREKANRVSTQHAVLDTCGTGGDSSGTFNVSTAAAFVAAGAGAHVAKHGNRAMTSTSGSADVLEALGARINLTPEQVQTCLEQTGICFMFAPNFHPAMKFAGPTRGEIGIRTVFNILGPLTNPAGATAQVLGVPNPGLVEFMAGVLVRLGTNHALVVSGNEGLDELSISGPSTVCEAKDGSLSTYTIEPEKVALTRYDRTAVQGGTPAENAQLLRQVLSGDRSRPAVTDFVLLNAGAGLVACDLATDLTQGVQLAAEVVNSGAALRKLDEFVSATQSFEVANVG
jgi:anthranilate phosphoribosyltransferase